MRLHIAIMQLRFNSSRAALITQYKQETPDYNLIINDLSSCHELVCPNLIGTYVSAYYPICPLV